MVRAGLRIALCFLMSAAHAAPVLRGAGSTFAEPLYHRWGSSFQGDGGSVGIEYSGVGSGEGIRRAEAHTVEFGASDEPLSQTQLDAKGMRQFPIAMGAIVPAVNLQGIGDGQLKLNATILAKIYLGQIKRWRDPAILALNGDLANRMPDLPIMPIRRSESSGSTFVFTYYLTANSEAWKAGPGTAKQLSSLPGAAIEGSKGVVEATKRTPGAIAYVDFGRARQAGLSVAQLPNRFGDFMKASDESIRAAAKFAAEKSVYGRTQDFYMILTNSDTYDGWPMATATFVLLPAKRTENVVHALEFLNWSFKNGDGAAKDLGYVPLPDLLKVGVRKAWSQTYGYKMLR
ncbi:phosphate ABC transporter substrate-binding protein PstS [Burkholderiaceae bacterium DAT-1]|nr:phosphate ABC transporter substrate-binding protein PstS [Burkholderiaceae bacterium DAT-1]